MIKLNFKDISFINSSITDTKKWIISLLPSSSDSPLKSAFTNLGFENGVFIIDYLNFFLWIGIILCIHTVFFLFVKVPQRSKTFIGKIRMRIHHFFTLTIYLRIFGEANLFMMIAACIEFDNEHTTIASVISIMAATMALVAMIAFCLFALKHYIRYRNKNYSEVEKYSAFYEGIRENKIAKFYWSFFLIRRLILVAFVAYVDIALPQIIALITIQFSSVLFMLIVRPFYELQDNIINCINELSTLSVCWFFMTMRDDSGLSDSEVEQRTGIMIYILTGVSLLCSLISFIFVTILIWSIIKKIRKRRLELRKQKYESKTIESNNNLCLQNEELRTSNHFEEEKVAYSSRE